MESLEFLRKSIAKEVPFVDIKPYSHNIIGILLGMIEKGYGRAEAINAMYDFDLEELGWSIPNLEEE